MYDRNEDDYSNSSALFSCTKALRLSLDRGFPERETTCCRFWCPRTLELEALPNSKGKIQAIEFVGFLF